MSIRGLFVGCVLILGGCSGTVTPPANPPRPTAVYLCDYGYHSSLLLPVGTVGTYVEYLFGDWDWAALNDTGVWPAVRAAVFSPQATLGRRYVYEPGVSWPRPMTTPDTQARLWVDGDRCRALQLALDARWRAAAGTATDDGADGGYYVYVKDAERYTLAHNCNRVTADWLDALGCDTGGRPVLSHFQVRDRR